MLASRILKGGRSSAHIKLGDFFEERFQKSGGLNELQAAIYNKEKALEHTPVDAADRRVQLLQGLARCLRARYQRLEDLKDLETTMQRYQEALDQIPADHTERAQILFSHAQCFGDRYEKLGHLEDFEVATKGVQDILDLVPANHPYRVKAFRGLAVCFQMRYRKLGDAKDLHIAIQKYQELLEQIPDNHPERAQILFQLATSSEDRYQKLGNVNDLQIAIEHAQVALDLIAISDPLRLRVLRGIAWCLQIRFQRLGDLGDLKTAIHKYQEILDQIPANHSTRAQIVYDLARSFRHLYLRQGQWQDLDGAALNSQLALKLTATDHPLRIHILQLLAQCFQHRYNALGELRDLDDARRKYDEVLEKLPPNHSDKAQILFNIATCYGDRYERLKDLSDLQAATKRTQGVLYLTPMGHPRRAQVLRGLAWCFRNRYQRSGDVIDVENAIGKYQEVLELTPADHPDIPPILVDLASSFGDRYQRLGDVVDLNAAMQKTQMALELIPTDHRLRVSTLGKSATYFRYQYKRSGNVLDLETAIHKYQETVDLTPPHLNNTRGYYLQCLGISLRDRYRKSGDSEDLRTSIQEFRQAVSLITIYHPHRAEILQGLASCLTDRYERFGKHRDLKEAQDLYIDSFQTPILFFPETSWDAALEWASFSKRHKPSYGLSAYSAAFNLLPEILWIGNDISVRHDTVRRLNIGPVTSNATRTHIKLSNLTSGVQMLEQGVATVFQQMLQLRPDVDTLPHQMADNFRKLSSELYSGTADDPGNVAIQRKSLLDKIRAQRGHQYFLLPKTYAVLCRASQGGPVVILNSHEDGCDAIIILNPVADPIHVPLPNVTLRQLKSQQIMLKKLLGRCNVRSRDESVGTRLFGIQEEFPSMPIQECFGDLLKWLWNNIVDPVYQALTSRGIHNGRLWWLPTGSFSGLPLHASAPSDPDPFIHSYTATLGSLLEAQTKKSAKTLKLGVVGITHTGPGGQNYLQGVEQEVKKICTIAQISGLQCLQGERARPDAVKQQLQDCGWVHLACHGIQDLVEPTKSRLLLYEGRLELETILRMPLSNAEFAFLAACQIAMGDSELVNESFHLGGGFIAAGFQSAVGTLWSMNDQDGPLIAEKFYSYLFRNGRRPQATDTAEALNIAVKELRVRNVPYERWVPFIHMGI
ncbi:CHAT domain-containing protein [Mycena maculata]|uniref:CHAT domain-containing protein n=1 Tax=Mycena maculata TaxID=230809 RepID=A0AAD7J8D0_9AGAR|nr:CHAT domain-containing protein [Mycena maculata]